MAKITLKILGFPQTANILKEDTIHAETIREIIQHIESRYPRDYYTPIIFLNGVQLGQNASTSLRDGDEVILVPIFSGG